MAISKNLQKLLIPSKIVWTNHAKMKMAFYGLSESRIRRVVKSPLRIEEGIAEKTAACMQPSSYKFKDGQKTWAQEIWVMFVIMSGGKSVVSSEKNKKTNEDSPIPFPTTQNSIRIISAWRYPGITKPGIPLPDIIQSEIDEGLSTEGA